MLVPQAVPRPLPLAPYRRLRTERTYQDWFRMGERLRRRGRYVKALEAYSRASEIRNDANELLLGSGEAYLGLGESRIASDVFQRALKLAPDSRRARAGLLTALSSIEERTPKENAYLRALEGQQQRKFVQTIPAASP